MCSSAPEVATSKAARQYRRHAAAAAFADGAHGRQIEVQDSDVVNPRRI
jgi:hypothetical protein